MHRLLGFTILIVSLISCIKQHEKRFLDELEVVEHNQLKISSNEKSKGFEAFNNNPDSGNLTQELENAGNEQSSLKGKCGKLSLKLLLKSKGKWTLKIWRTKNSSVIEDKFSGLYKKIKNERSWVFLDRKEHIQFSCREDIFKKNKKKTVISTICAIINHNIFLKFPDEECLIVDFSR